MNVLAILVISHSSVSPIRASTGISAQDSRPANKIVSWLLATTGNNPSVVRSVPRYSLKLLVHARISPCGSPLPHTTLYVITCIYSYPLSPVFIPPGSIRLYTFDAV